LNLAWRPIVWTPAMHATVGAILVDEVRATQARRDSAFESLIEARLDASYRLATAILGDRVEAEDATHDALVRAQRHWPSLRDPDAAVAWLDRIVVNVCRDRLRRRRRMNAMVARIAGRAETGLDAPDALDPGVAEAVHSALAALEPDHRVAVVLRYFLDLPLEAIAARTGVPTGTVKSRLHHALDHLRAAYDAAERSGVDR
jgi:RNA polymerase sigma factor (sigma-70 family)